MNTRGRVPVVICCGAVIVGHRWTAAAVVHRDCMYVFGGFFGYAGLAKPNGRLNDLWRFDFSTGWWTQLGAYGDLPCARSHHSMTVVNDR